MASVIAASAAGESKVPPISEKHYRIYRGDGTAATLDDILAQARQADVIFLGEGHEDAVAHYLESEVLVRLHGPTPNLVLSLEMFERDVQLEVNEYLAGQITEQEFLRSSRPWGNYKTDYRPLLEFAKEHKLPVMAANAPARYVNRVGRLGKESLAELSDSAKTYLPPLPYASASTAYQDAFRKVMSEAGQESKKEASKRRKHDKADSAKSSSGHGSGDLRLALEAQSLWDATMAYSISQALESHSGSHVVQVNGGFHSQSRLGILEHLQRYQPQAKSLVVSMQASKSFPAWDAKTMTGIGDFVIVTDPSMTPKSRPKRSK